jgi:hypothetical protein
MNEIIPLNGRILIQEISRTQSSLIVIPDRYQRQDFLASVISSSSPNVSPTEMVLVRWLFGNENDVLSLPSHHGFGRRFLIPEYKIIGRINNKQLVPMGQRIKVKLSEKKRRDGEIFLAENQRPPIGIMTSCSPDVPDDIRSLFFGATLHFKWNKNHVDVATDFGHEIIMEYRDVEFITFED